MAQVPWVTAYSRPVVDRQDMARAGIILAALVEDMSAYMRMQAIRLGELTETLHNYRQLRY